MKKIIESVAQLKQRLFGSDNRSAIVSLGCIILILAGGVSMMLQGSGDSRFVVLDDKLSGELVKEAGVYLVQNDISNQIRDGKLFVKSADLKEASTIISKFKKDKTIISSESKNGSYGKISAGQSLWRSESQNMRIWQARKMDELSRLITNMQPIKKAVVLFEAGKSGGLGSKEIKSTAAVHVTLEPSKLMTARLIKAMADLISGSIASLELQDIKIVDASGRSYTCDETVNQLAGINLHESEFSTQILSIMPAGIKTKVNSIQDGKKFRVHIAATGNVDTQKIRENVNKMFGDQISGLIVEQVATEEPQVFPVESKSSVDYAAAGIVAMILAGLGYVVIRRVRKKSESLETEDVTTAFNFEDDLEAKNEAFDFEIESVKSPEIVETSAAGPFDFLAAVNGSQILDMIREEKPQTIAIILKHLSEIQVDEVLDELSEQWRDSVLNHMSQLQQVDQQIIEDIAAAVWAKMQALETKNPEDTTPSRLTNMEFEDLITVDSIRLGNAFEAVNQDDLAISLRTAGREMKKKIFNSLTPSAARRVKRRMERIGPVRLSEVESARQRVMDSVSSILFGKWVSVSGENNIL